MAAGSEEPNGARAHLDDVYLKLIGIRWVGLRREVLAASRALRAILAVNIQID
jgi:hypothetical protein